MGKAHQINIRPTQTPIINNPQSVPILVSSLNILFCEIDREKRAYPDTDPRISKLIPTISKMIENAVITIGQCQVPEHVCLP